MSERICTLWHFEPMLLQLLKHSFKLSEVVFYAVAVHDDAIQVHQEDLQEVFAKDNLSQSLKKGRRITQSEGHSIVWTFNCMSWTKWSSCPHR